MSEPTQDELDRLRVALEAELRARQAGKPPVSGPPPESAGQVGALAQAMRLSTEFVAGLAVGAALGYGADRLLGTSPWGFILFFLLGFVASVVNVFRAAGLMKPRQHSDS
jgi:ATP synthase protein I